MDIYRSLADFVPPSNSTNVLSLRIGEELEVYEFEVDRGVKDWWAAKRLRDGAVGFVPCQYLMWCRKGKGQTPEGKQERDRHVQNLEAMQNNGDHLPELYKLPPLEIKSIDKWREGGDGEGPDVDVPEPDYEDQSDESPTHKEGDVQIILPMRGDGVPDDDDGENTDIVRPKKLVNPVMQSKQHMNLHRELRLSHKRGEPLGGHKSELQKEFSKRKDKQKKKEKEEDEENSKTDIQKKLEEQAEKLRKTEIQESKSSEGNQSEFLRIHSKIQRTKSDS